MFLSNTSVCFSALVAWNVNKVILYRQKITIKHFLVNSIISILVSVVAASIPLAKNNYGDGLKTYINFCEV